MNSVEHDGSPIVINAYLHSFENEIAKVLSKMEVL